MRRFPFALHFMRELLNDISSVIFLDLSITERVKGNGKDNISIGNLRARVCEVCVSAVEKSFRRSEV